MRYLSPLRYPGGKAKLAPFFSRLWDANAGTLDTYAEPFAGGGAAGLALLERGTARRFLVNDLNPGVAAFWRAVTATPGEFCARIRSVPVTVAEWHQQHEIYVGGQGSDLDLGFATFFLNRTNRSGILRGRPIGGLEQKGSWKIDARFNKVGLCKRVEWVGAQADKIVVSAQDALYFLASLQTPTNTLVYVDPPYMAQGDRLYFNRFSPEQHDALARSLSTARYPWVLTYDTHDRVVDDLYRGYRCAEFGITHSAQIHRDGRELIVFCNRLLVPDLDITRGHETTIIA